MPLKLSRLGPFSGRVGPLLLIIMDGIGVGPKCDGNAAHVGDTPNLDRLVSSEFYCELQAHGTAVGLPTDKDMGNSEVGHNALGAGRIFEQGARLVNRAIESGRIFETDVWDSIVESARAGGSIHFIGLLSDGNVHSHIEQLYKMIDKCADLGLKGVRVHALLDGRFNTAFSDVQRVYLPAMRHRVLLNFEGEAEGVSTDDVLKELLEKTPTMAEAAA